MDLTSLKNLDLNTPEASLVHAQLIQGKPFLKKIYLENYEFFKTHLASAPSGRALELGTGGGFIKTVIPEALTSDVVRLPGLNLTLSGLSLPFATGSLSAIMMINVLHHIQNVEQFFTEATRCLTPGGVVLMVEPAHTIISRVIYQNFHHEPFDPKQVGWELDGGGRMTSANDALPWILFHRDRKIFEEKFPDLSIEYLRNFLPFRYILSGGVSRPQMLPNFSYPIVCAVEALLSPIRDYIGMFMQIVVRKRG